MNFRAVRWTPANGFIGSTPAITRMRPSRKAPFPRRATTGSSPPTLPAARTTPPCFRRRANFTRATVISRRIFSGPTARACGRPSGCNRRRWAVTSATRPRGARKSTPASIACRTVPPTISTIMSSPTSIGTATVPPPPAPAAAIIPTAAAVSGPAFTSTGCSGPPPVIPSTWMTVSRPGLRPRVFPRGRSS